MEQRGAKRSIFGWGSRIIEKRENVETSKRVATAVTMSAVMATARARESSRTNEKEMG